MATLTNSTGFTIAAQSTATASVSVPVVAAAAAGEGRGRLIHPTYGTYDYDYMPNQWRNMDGDAIIFPTWQTSPTLSSAQNTLWNGNTKDVTCTEAWTAPGGLAMPMDMLRMLILFYTNPPDPTVDYVQWWPSYTNGNGYDVVITNLSVGDEGIAFSDISQQGWMDSPVAITYQIIGSAA